VEHLACRHLARMPCADSLRFGYALGDEIHLMATLKLHSSE